MLSAMLPVSKSLPNNPQAPSTHLAKYKVVMNDSSPNHGYHMIIV